MSFCNQTRRLWVLVTVLLVPFPAAATAATSEATKVGPQWMFRCSVNHVVNRIVMVPAMDDEAAACVRAATLTDVPANRCIGEDEDGDGINCKEALFEAKEAQRKY